MTLRLSERQAAGLARLARAVRPREACGLIGGDDGRAIMLRVIDNRAREPETQFRLDERQMVAAMFEFERAGLRLLAIWHSHPHGEPLPSARDIREAAWPDIAQLIVGLKGGRAQLAAWRIAHGEVGRIPLQIGEQPSEAVPARPSPAQGRATMLAIFLAGSLLLWAALGLLPPAPPIP